MAGDGNGVARHELNRCFKAMSPLEEKEAKRMKVVMEKKMVPEEQVEHLLSFMTMEPIFLPVVSADSDDNYPNSLRNEMDRLLIRAINRIKTTSQVIRQMLANAREDLRTKGHVQALVADFPNFN
uniref:Uncharacterized protein n=1 Tax=Oryza glumipatula TaxID=40148 RepID=A0A0E0BER1_9ORYZ